MSPRVPLVLLAALLVSTSASAMPLGKTKLVSHATTGSLTGGPGGDNSSFANFGENYDQPISDNGRYVPFLSDARNLQTAIPDSAVSTRLYRADLFTGAIQMVDVNAAGTGNAVGADPTPDKGYPNAPQVSADGRLVFWHSGAKDLVAGFVDGAATNDTASDVYVRDMQTGVTSLLSRSTASATQGGNGDTGWVVVTPDGRYVLMYSKATDLVSGVTDTNGGYDLFQRDLQTGTTKLVTEGATANTAVANGGVDYYVMTPDGRYVVYTRNGNVSDVIPGDSGSGYNVYRRDMQTGTTELLSPTAGSATTGSGGIDSGVPPMVSDDGRYVVFAAPATTLVGTDTNAEEDVFLRDATSHTTTLVSRNAAGTDSAAGGLSTNPRISPDGRYVVFLSGATDVVSSPADTAGTDVFRYDRTTGTNALASPRSDGSASAGDTHDDYALMSNDGRYIAFASKATTLVAGFTDNNTNAKYDIYKRDMDAGTTSLVSSAPGSSTAGANQDTDHWWMTPDGRFVTYTSSAGNLVSPATGTAVDNFFVRGNFPPQSLGIATAAGADSFSFSFTGSATDPDGSIMGYSWLFGDGGSASGATPSHTYAAPGTDTVTLTATDDEGETSQTTKSVSPAAPPVVTTSPATGLTGTGATLAATAANPDTQGGTLHFEYGTTTAYGTSTADQALSAALASTAFSAAVTGLTPGTTYHFRAVATNRAGTVRGIDRVFRTKAPAQCLGGVRLARRPKVATDGASVSAVVNAPCAGRLKGTLTRLGAARAAATKKQPLRTLGTTTKTVTAGGHVRLTVRLTTAAKQLLAQRRRLRARLTVAFKPTTGASSKKATTVTLKARKKRG